MNKVKKPSIKHITEAVEYPYSIGLPRSFDTFLQSSSIDYILTNNQVMVTFQNKTQFLKSLRILNKSKDNAATIIIDGIIRSLKL